MSEAKRYAMTWATDENEFVYVSPVESASGNWVNYEDYAKLQAELRRVVMDGISDIGQLGEQSAEITNLKAEVARLRKAGDEILNKWQSNSGSDVERFTKAYWLWITAKEGKPSA